MSALIYDIQTIHDTDAELLDQMVFADAAFIPVQYRYHGPDHDKIAPGRYVLAIPGIAWDYNPETCAYAATHPAATTWLLDGEVLVCRGCGIDCT